MLKKITMQRITIDSPEDELCPRNNTYISTESKQSDYKGKRDTQLTNLLKNSGIYALSSLVNPLIALTLAPFLTHTLSTTDYGILTSLNTFISLAAGITQLGLSSAFFRAYNYDYIDSKNKRDVVATAAMLLFIVSLLFVVATTVTAPFLAKLLFRRSSLGPIIIIASSIIFVQNLTVISFAWLRAESRALLFSLLSIGNLLVTLVATIILVGILRWGIIGSLIATGGGYLSIVICTIPLIILRTGIRIRIDIARNMLGFGIPLLPGFVSYWILQVSDRYLLSHFSSFTETARYAVAYNLGSALGTVVISPFTLAWPVAVFELALRKNASRLFKLVFHWFSLFLLWSAFGLSLIATLTLNWLFPLAYHSAASIIPIISLSGVFYGLYYIFAAGVNIKSKTWMISIFTSLAAIVNFLLNLLLIPRYGAMGAAISTLIAFIVLALITYIVNQKIYYIAFEIGRFITASLIGTAIYFECSLVTHTQKLLETLVIYTSALAFYTCCLVTLGMLPAWKKTRRKYQDISIEDTDIMAVPLKNAVKTLGVLSILRSFRSIEAKNKF